MKSVSNQKTEKEAFEIYKNDEVVIELNKNTDAPLSEPVTKF